MTEGFTRRQLLVGSVGAAAASVVAKPARAQSSWRPSKPIRIVVGDTAGGGTDQISRIFAEYMSTKLGQSIFVDNKSGANGLVAATDLKNSAADGYTLLYTTSGLMTQKFLHKSLPYDHAKDFQPVGACPVAGLAMVANPITGANNLKEFVEYARKSPVSIGTFGVGTLAHIAAAEMEKLYGIPFAPVHYRGGAPMWADLAGGSLHAAIGGAAGAQNIVDMGKGKVIAIQGPTRLMRFPDVSTFKEQGATSRSLAITGYTCMMASAAVPENIIDAYSRLMVEAGRDETTWQKLLTIGTEERPIGRAQFQRWIVEEVPIWGELITSLGLTPN